MRHLQTYARLRRAGSDYLEAVLALQRSITPHDPLPGARWAQYLVSRAVRVTLAVEGGIVVGAVVEVHRTRSPVAKLVALGVVPSARGRGIGSLLLDAVISQARGEGAAVLAAEPDASAADLRHLLGLFGFQCVGAADSHAVRYLKSLWNPRHSSRFDGEASPVYANRGGSDGGVCALMTAMAALDRTILLTPRLESVLRYEVGSGDCATRLALAAAQRGFRVCLHTTQALPALATSQISVMAAAPTAEQMIGALSRGHLPLVHGHLARLHHNEGPRWVLLAGFDGYLFRVIDPQTADSGALLAVTLGEMRACLQGPDPATALLLQHPARF